MINKKQKTNLFIIFILILLLAICIPSGIQIADAINQNINNFDNVSVVDDLKDMSINGIKFDFDDYQPNSGQCELINFVEFGYSKLTEYENSFALYLYIYNPQQLNIATGSLSNKVHMSLEFDEKNNGINYKKYTIHFCNKTENNLFYKFRIIDEKNENDKTIKDYLDTNKRKYALSGIELFEYGKINAVDYKVGKTFTFSGYAKGMSDKTLLNSTLAASSEYLDTIKLNVKHTNYRTGVSELGVGHQNEVNSVYFSVPNQYLDNYGTLRKIKAEWYEYKTNPIYVTDDAQTYETLSSKRGVRLSQYLSSDFGTEGLYNKNVPARIYSENHPTIAYNCKFAQDLPNNDLLTYLFYKDNVSDDSVFDFLNKYDSGIKGSKLSEYIRNYDKSDYNGYLPIKDESISADLFSDSVDKNRVRGHNIATVDLEDTFNLKSYDSNHGWFDKFLHFGLFKPNTGETHIDVAPIYKVENDDFNGCTSSNLLVNSQDTEKIKSAYKNSSNNDESLFLFRFANTDYFSDKAEIYNKNSCYSDLLGFVSDHAYVAQETVFFDFDIISLTFCKNDVLTTIPVVSDPIDIINGITPPIKDNEVVDKSILDSILMWGSAAFSLIGLFTLFLFIVIVVAKLIIPLLQQINIKTYVRSKTCKKR